VSNILDAQRAARIVEQHAIDETLPGLEEVIDALLTTSFDTRTNSGYEAEVKRAVQRVVVDQLMRLAGTADMAQVRAVATMKLRYQEEMLNGGMTGASPADGAHFALLAQDIERFMERPATPFDPVAIPDAPPGAPIGDPGMDWLGTLYPVCSWDTGRW
jgi:hypothetical protein